MLLIQPRSDPLAGRPDTPPRVATAIALIMVSGVWIAGALWSFEEQTAFAAAADFRVPCLLPLTLDGLALALAAVATAASFDGRPAMQARLGTALAVASSAASNARWAWERTHGDTSPVVLGAGVPMLSFLAFEVLLAELRRQVHRHRGLPAPAAVPPPRLIRLALAPRRAFAEWRDDALRRTAPQPVPASTLLSSKPARAHGHGGGPADVLDSDRQLLTRRRPPVEGSFEMETPAHRRSIEALRTELAASIKNGTLPANPTAEAIRKALRIGLDRARQLRDETGA
jgi:hypothetical protein